MYICEIATDLSLALLGGGGASTSIEFSTEVVQNTVWCHMTLHTLSQHIVT